MLPFSMISDPKNLVAITGMPRDRNSRSHARVAFKVGGDNAHVYSCHYFVDVGKGAPVLHAGNVHERLHQRGVADIAVEEQLCQFGIDVAERMGEEIGAFAEDCRPDKSEGDRPAILRGERWEVGGEIIGWRLDAVRHQKCFLLRNP